MSENTATLTSQLVNYVEVWLPTAAGDRVRLESAIKVQPTGNSTVEPDVAELAPGDGVAGRAWHQKSVTILQESPSEVLDAISQSCGVTLKAVVAIPVFEQQTLRGVVVLGFGEGYGATEVWTRDDRDELSVSLATYSGLPSFEFMNRYVRFPKGAGLPGQIWKSGHPKLVQHLATNEAFVRTFDNDPAHLDAAIGIPIGTKNGFPAAVLLMLSARQSPFAKSVELWECQQSDPPEDDQPPKVTIESCQAVGIENSFSPNEWHQPLIAKIESTRSPFVLTSDNGLLPDGYSLCLCVPIFRSQEIVGVLNLMF